MPVPMEVHVIPVKGVQRLTLIYVENQQADVIDGWNKADVNKAVQGVIMFCFKRGFKAKGAGVGRVQASEVTLKFFNTEGGVCGTVRTFGRKDGQERTVTSDCPDGWGKVSVDAGALDVADSDEMSGHGGGKGFTAESRAKAAATRKKNAKAKAVAAALKTPEMVAARQRGRDKAKAAKAKAAAAATAPATTTKKSGAKGGKRPTAAAASPASISPADFLAGILPKAAAGVKTAGKAVANAASKATTSAGKAARKASGGRAPNAWNAFSSQYRASHPGAKMPEIRKAYKAASK